MLIMTIHMFRCVQAFPCIHEAVVHTRWSLCTFFSGVPAGVTDHACVPSSSPNPSPPCSDFVIPQSGQAVAAGAATGKRRGRPPKYIPQPTPPPAAPPAPAAAAAAEAGAPPGTPKGVGASTGAALGEEAGAGADGAGPSSAPAPTQPPSMPTPETGAGAGGPSQVLATVPRRGRGMGAGAELQGSNPEEYARVGGCSGRTS